MKPQYCLSIVDQYNTTLYWDGTRFNSERVKYYHSLLILGRIAADHQGYYEEKIQRHSVFPPNHFKRNEQ